MFSLALVSLWAASQTDLERRLSEPRFTVKPFQRIKSAGEVYCFVVVVVIVAKAIFPSVVLCCWVWGLSLFPFEMISINYFS